jgi:hypothetical protein
MYYIIGELKIEIIIWLNCLKESWHNKRWISPREYERSRGN